MTDNNNIKEGSSNIKLNSLSAHLELFPQTAQVTEKQVQMK